MKNTYDGEEEVLYHVIFGALLFAVNLFFDNAFQ